MTKTNKEFRSDLAKEMRDKYNQRNEELDRIEKSSYSEGLREQMRKKLMDNFYAEIDEMKKRPGYEEARKTHLAEIKAKSGVRKAKKAKEQLLKEYEEKLAKADADISDSKKSYEDAQIAHRGKVEEDSENSESLEIPQELKDYREAWKVRISNINYVIKESIIKAAEKIKLNVKQDNDGSRLTEFKLGEKKWKILDPKLNSHTNQSYAYVNHVNYDSVTNIKKDYVKLRGMRGDKVDDWDNEELAAYVKEKQQEGLHIPSENEMKKLLAELGKEINSDELSHQIAMLMYLTGMDGRYWLSMRDSSSRSGLKCYDDSRYFEYDRRGDSGASLCMIACN